MTSSGSSGDVEKSGGRTVVVGVKLDSQSRELLTWALVKVAQPGDSVIALHVLGHNGNYVLSVILFLSVLGGFPFWGCSCFLVLLGSFDGLV